MKKVKRMAAQGDVMFIRVDALPAGLKKLETNIVAHSETGHHHVAEGEAFELFSQSPMMLYLRADEPTPIVHRRPFDTHETLLLDVGFWKVPRQREWAPEGLRRVED